MLKKIFMVLVSCVVLTMLVATIALAAPADQPKTGQTICYDASGAVISCASTTANGQDGALQKGVAWPNPRFTANADTSVTDNLTGLVWAANGNLMPTRDSGWDADGTANDGMVTWQHALDYVAKLNTDNYLGHNDWRLPDINELESLVNAGQSNTAAWLNTQGFTNAQANLPKLPQMFYKVVLFYYKYLILLNWIQTAFGYLSI